MICSRPGLVPPPCRSPHVLALTCSPAIPTVRAITARLACRFRVTDLCGQDAGQSVILVNLTGGLSHLDSLDMKPDAPAEIRGEFKPIATAVPGIQVCEHLPQLARRMATVALVRSLSHGENGHLPARTGCSPARPCPTSARPTSTTSSRDATGPATPPC